MIIKIIAVGVGAGADGAKEQATEGVMSLALPQKLVEGTRRALREQGVPMKADRDLAWRNFAGWRVNYDSVLTALAHLTMAP